MASFIPIIVVVRRTSFLSAFDECTELWARHAKNAAVLVIIGGLLLLLPVSQEGLSYGTIPTFSSWDEALVKLLLLLFKISAGVFIMCSMVVFCRKIHEEEEQAQPEAEGI